MLKYLCALCFALLPASVCSAQTTANDVADYSKEALIYEKVSTKQTFQNDGTGQRETALRIRMQSEAGVHSLGVLKFSYQSSVETLEVGSVRVHKPDGTTVITPLDAMQDMPADITREAPFYSDIKEKHVAVKGMGVGDVLEYQYTLRLTKPLAPGQFWLDYNFIKDSICLEEELEVRVPRERSIKLKSSGVKEVVAEEAPYRVYRWKTSNLRGKKSDSDEDQKKQWEAIRGLAPGPDVRLSSFQSWEQVGRWYADLQADRVKPGPQIRAKAAEITKNAADEDAKLHAIYNYVSTNFRYIGVAFGIGRYQPHAADEVLNNQYGDCKDKHTLLASLLTAAGITAAPALISVGRQTDPEVPSPAQFDHVITAVSRGDKLLWLDSTAEVAPFGYLLPQLRDKPALVIADNNPARLVTTPADLPFKNNQVFKVEGTLNEDGVLEGKIERTDRGDVELLLRSVFRRLPQAQWKDLVQNISYGSGFGGTVSDVVASVPEVTDSPFSVRYTYSRKDYSDWQDRQITPPLPPFNLAILKDDQTKFVAPLWLGGPSELILQANIKLPKGYKPQLPEKVDAVRDFAEYHATYQFHDGVLVAERRLVALTREVAVQQFEQYKSFRKAITDDETHYIRLTTKDSNVASNSLGTVENSVWSLPDTANPEARRIAEDGAAALRRLDIRSAIASLKRAVEVDPKYTRAWIMLAVAQTTPMTPGGTDPAMVSAGIEAFRRAIAVNPKEEVIYRIFGFTLMRLEKYEQAIKVWQELLEIAPDDEYAPGNLAASLFKLGKYKESAAAWEKAADVKDSPTLEIERGKAYFRAGDDDKGYAAFQKAFEVDDEARDATQNSVAYELAELDKRLPDALKYAQEAVSTLEEETRQITVSNLNNADLECVRELSAYWDTLGWVYFHLHEFDLAANYLAASWSLSQNAIVGDHLGQLYEAQHKTRQAAHMYAMTLAAQQSMTDTRARLVPLLAKGSTLNGTINDAREDLSRQRSVHLQRLVTGHASAEFFVIFDSDASVREAHFISGDEKLKSAEKVLARSKFDITLPEGFAGRLVRRGILSCSEVTGCEFVLFTPDTVRSVD